MSETEKDYCFESQFFFGVPEILLLICFIGISLGSGQVLHLGSDQFIFIIFMAVVVIVGSCLLTVFQIEIYSFV